MAKYLGETERVKIEGNARKKEGRKEGKRKSSFTHL